MENIKQGDFRWEEYKTCTKCKEVQHIDMFHRDGTRRKSRCKGCRKEEAVMYWRTHPHVRERHLQKQKARRNANGKFVHEYKLKHPCMECGEADPIVLEFDHRDPKIKCFAISQGCADQRSIEPLKAEMDKCDVLCANCHRRKTAKQLGYYSYRVIHGNKAEMVE